MCAICRGCQCLRARLSTNFTYFHFGWILCSSLNMRCLVRLGVRASAPLILLHALFSLGVCLGATRPAALILSLRQRIFHATIRRRIFHCTQIPFLFCTTNSVMTADGCFFSFNSCSTETKNRNGNAVASRNENKKLKFIELDKFMHQYERAPARYPANNCGWLHADTPDTRRVAWMCVVFQRELFLHTHNT